MRKAKPGISDRESLIKDGEGSHTGGFNVQTPNGSGEWRGTGWNWLPPMSSPEVAPKPTWPAGRTNRTAE